MTQPNHTQPNIVLILTDDQGWGDLSRNGNTQISTPAIDQLAADGVSLDNFHVQPLCAPTRAEILTGRYFPWTGVKGVTRCAERLKLDETTIGDVFKQAGYATGCFGKWHSGLQYPYHPNGRGFDTFYGYCCGHWSHYFDSTIEENGKDVTAPGYLTDALTSRAIQFIKDNKDKPFLCYVPLNTPHSPWQVPDQWFEKFKDHPLPQRATHPEKEEIEKTRTALAMCENIDWNVGRLVGTLDQLALRENTIVIYLSDNGPNTWRYNGGMDGKKGSCQEGGVRSPCSITWPGTIPANQAVDRVTGAIDLLPTLAELAAVPIKTSKPLDGKSLEPLLMSNDAVSWEDRCIYAQQVSGYGGRFDPASLRTDRYRAYEDGRVYDLVDDIGETTDVADQIPELAASFKRQLQSWRGRLPDQFVDTAIPVGYPEFPMTYLPAQDAEPTGQITWSSVHPNCSWLHHWQSTDDHVNWFIRIKTTGRYAVTLMYACPVDDVGSELVLRYQDQEIVTTISESFDPQPLTGFDRVQRNGSYEKAFKPLYMGEIVLDASEGHLQLACKKIAGSQVCEVRALKLELLSED